MSMLPVRLERRFEYDQDKPRARLVWRPTERHLFVWILTVAVLYFGAHVLAWVVGR